MRVSESQNRTGREYLHRQGRNPEEAPPREGGEPPAPPFPRGAMTERPMTAEGQSLTVRVNFLKDFDVPAMPPSPMMPMPPMPPRSPPRTVSPEERRILTRSRSRERGCESHRAGYWVLGTIGKHWVRTRRFVSLKATLIPSISPCIDITQL